MGIHRSILLVAKTDDDQNDAIDEYRRRDMAIPRLFGMRCQAGNGWTLHVEQAIAPCW
jgi:hypothetical protein